MNQENNVNDYPVTGTLHAPAEGEVLLRGVLLYGDGDPSDVLVRDGVIAEIGAAGTLTADAAEVLDLDGQVLLPGLVDMHVHLREPGREDTETIASGSAAAARGGFTAVFTMANTQPVTDNPAVAEMVWLKGQQTNLCDVHPVGSISAGLKGAELTEFGMMAASEAKVRMFSDDGKCVAEESIVIRDALLARDYGGRVHICHASTEGTVELLRWAKDHDIPLTAEVTPHHLVLTDGKLESYDGNFRVNPPLREERDTLALRAALLDGTIDCVATDHAPHGSEEKCCEFDHARPGMLGLETSLALVARTFAGADGTVDWRFVAKVMSERPAQITKLPGHGRPLAVGEPANLCVVDTRRTWTAHGADLASKASNTPYEGEEMPVKVSTTLLRGRVTCRDGEAVTE
jgi:dihydroorotase